MAGLIYLDSSALLKRVLPEPESVAFRAWLTDRIGAGSALVSSALADVEVARACLRMVGSAEAARGAMTGVHRHDITADIIGRARTIGPPALRSLDAIHLATADACSVDMFIAYDTRLTEAARATGLPVVVPA